VLFQRFGVAEPCGQPRTALLAVHRALRPRAPFVCSVPPSSVCRRVTAGAAFACCLWLCSEAASSQQISLRPPQQSRIALGCRPGGAVGDVATCGVRVRRGDCSYVWQIPRTGSSGGGAQQSSAALPAALHCRAPLAEQMCTPTLSLRRTSAPIRTYAPPRRDIDQPSSPRSPRRCRPSPLIC